MQSCYGKRLRNSTSAGLKSLEIKARKGAMETLLERFEHFVQTDVTFIFTFKAHGTIYTRL